jgi:nucleoside-diphosphate-sugar epimerase
MRIIVIGGSGHIGTYLVPRLVTLGNTVLCVSRGERKPYQPHAAWSEVEQVKIDRIAAESDGSFGQAIRALNPDVVIDLTCFHLQSAQQLVESLRGRIQHFLHCGTIWVHGPAVELPTTEEQPRNPISDYGKRKAAIEAYLLSEARMNSFPATVLHPGHIVGPGWIPLNPAANFNPEVFIALARGEEVLLPNLGRETVHHVHADDVAQAFVKSIASRSVSVGESFHVVSPAALALGGYAEAVAAWFGQPAKLRFLPWEEWKAHASEDDASKTWDHIARSPNCSIGKAERLIGYTPRYRSLEAIQESLGWAVANKLLAI